VGCFFTPLNGSRFSESKVNSFTILLNTKTFSGEIYRIFSGAFFHSTRICIEVKDFGGVRNHSTNFL